MNEGERCPGGLAHLPFLCHESLRLLALARPFGYYNVFWISRFPTDKQLQNFRKPKANEEAQELKTLLAPKRRFSGRKKIGSLKKRIGRKEFRSENPDERNREGPSVSWGEDESRRAESMLIEIVESWTI
ncbi:unnamed protein product, partial [Nesidiocoris tenuis]